MGGKSSSSASTTTQDNKAGIVSAQGNQGNINIGSESVSIKALQTGADIAKAGFASNTAVVQSSNNTVRDVVADTTDTLGRVVNDTTGLIAHVSDTFSSSFENTYNNNAAVTGDIVKNAIEAVKSTKANEQIGATNIIPDITKQIAIGVVAYLVIKLITKKGA